MDAGQVLKKLQRIIDFAPMAIISIDQKLCVTEVNGVAARLLGLLPQEAVDRPIGDFFIEENGDDVQCCIESALKRGRVEISGQVRTLSGALVPVQAMIVALPEESPDNTAAALYITQAGNGVREVELLRKNDEEQQRADLLNAIVDGEVATSEIAIERGRSLGLDLSARYALFAITIDDFNGKSYLELQKDQRGVKELLRKVTHICAAEQDKIVWTRYDGFAVLCPLPDACADAKGQSINRARSGRERITRELLGVKLTVGVSSSYTEVLDVRRCYREAKEAASVGLRIWGGNGVYHYADLGICQLLTQFQDPEQLRKFLDRSLGKLIQHDKTKGTQLVATLEEILSAPNLKEAAERSFVHHKTIMFRKNRIEEILGVSLDDMENRLTLSTAMKILRLLPA